MTTITWKEIENKIKETIGNKKIFDGDFNIFTNSQSVVSISMKTTLNLFYSKTEEECEFFYYSCFDLQLLEIKIDGNTFNLLNFQKFNSYHETSTIESNTLITNDTELVDFLTEQDKQLELLNKLNYIPFKDKKYWFANNTGQLFTFDKQKITILINEQNVELEVPNVKLFNDLSLIK